MLNLALLFMNDILLLSRLNVLSSATAFSVVVSCRLSILSASLAIYCSGVTASMCNSWMATLSLSCRCRKLVLSVERNSFSFAARSGILPLSAQRILLRKNVRSLALLTVTLKEPLLQQSISTLSRDA